MTKWETKLFIISYEDCSNSYLRATGEISRRINELGNQGWEPFQFMKYHVEWGTEVYVEVWCKRPKEGEHYDRDSDRIS
jgi:hypothetical protein